MARLLAALLAGLLLGAALAVVLMRAAPSQGPTPTAPVVVRDIVRVPVMTVAEAESHRADRFARIRTIEDTLALPGDFSQTEALYVLAGRADSAGVQDLIHQANRIADPTDRNAAISILFLRLAELDPLSALTMSRMREFTSSRGLEQNIWRTWSKLDLDAAITAARQLRNPTERNLAAQTMLAAYGYMGNDITERIESELGIRASSEAHARYLYDIADRSISEAFAYVDALPPGQQREALQWLATYVGQRNPAQALGYANLITLPALRKEYESHIETAIAQHDPERILNEMPPGALRGNQVGRYMVAMHTLARTDIDRALAYYRGLEHSQSRAMLASVIAAELARQDVDRAIRWAQSEQQGREPNLLVNVLQHVASTDPELALSKLDQVGNPEVRQESMSGILAAIAQNDPRLAVSYLDEIQDPVTRRMSAQSIVMTWSSLDPEAAVGWLLSSDLPNSDGLLTQAGFHLVNNDVDAAIRLLPRVDERTAQTWRSSIATTLSTQRSPEEAQRFIDQYKNEPGYENLQATVITGVAQQDVYRARQLAEQLPPGQARDQSMQQLISYHLHSNPLEAASWLDMISDGNSRGQAAGQVLRQWYATDPHAASQWIMNYPPGRIRDDALLMAARSLGEDTPQSRRLILSIDDPQKRQQASMSQVMRIARSDPQQARAMIAAMNLSPEEREQLESMLQQVQEHSTRFVH